MSQTHSSYPTELPDKDLQLQIKQFIEKTKAHENFGSETEHFLSNASMVFFGHTELQSRGVKRSSRASIILGSITVFAALVSIFIAIQTTQQANEAGRRSDGLQQRLVQLQAEQATVLTSIRDEITKLNGGSRSLPIRQPNGHPVSKQRHDR